MSIIQRVLENLAKDTELFKDVVFIVEATSAERFMLWQLYHDRPRYPEAKVDKWEQVTMGTTLQIGSYNDRPIVVDISYAILNGKKVMFYSGCSQLVDHKLIEDWLKILSSHITTSDGRWAHSDAMNFHNCLRTIKE